MSAYGVLIASRHVERRLRAASRQDYLGFGRIRSLIRSLAHTPRPPGCVKLTGEDDLYRIRIRIGAWRVIYRVDDAAQEIVIAKVARRSEDMYA